MMPRIRWYERLLCWLLFRIEAKHGLEAGFDDIDIYAMKWFVTGNNMLLGHVCTLMRDYIYIRIAKEQRNR